MNTLRHRDRAELGFGALIFFASYFVALSNLEAFRDLNFYASGVARLPGDEVWWGTRDIFYILGVYIHTYVSRRGASRLSRLGSFLHWG
jgi:hypothetical protein